MRHFTHFVFLGTLLGSGFSAPPEEKSTQKLHFGKHNGLFSVIVNNYYSPYDSESEEDYYDNGEVEQEVSSISNSNCIAPTKGCIYPPLKSPDFSTTPPPGYCSQQIFLQIPLTYCDPENAVPCFQTETELEKCVSSCKTRASTCSPLCHNCFSDSVPFKENFPGGMPPMPDDYYNYDYTYAFEPNNVTVTVVVDEIPPLNLTERDRYSV